MAYDEALADRVRAHLDGEPGLTEKRMFGGLAFLVEGHLAVAVSNEGGLMLRTDPDETEALLAEPHTRPMVMRGRELSGWLRVEADGLGDDAELARWAGLGVARARSLPPA